MTEVQRFHGSAEQLIWMVALTGFQGEWEQLLNGHYIFRSHSGAVLNWWSSTKRVCWQGDADAARELEAALLRTFDPYDDILGAPGTNLPAIQPEK